MTDSKIKHQNNSDQKYLEGRKRYDTQPFKIFSVNPRNHVTPITLSSDLASHILELSPKGLILKNYTLSEEKITFHSHALTYKSQPICFLDLQSDHSISYYEPIPFEEKGVCLRRITLMGALTLELASRFFELQQYTSKVTFQISLVNIRKLPLIHYPNEVSTKEFRVPDQNHYSAHTKFKEDLKSEKIAVILTPVLMKICVFYGLELSMDELYKYAKSKISQASLSFMFA